MAKRAEHDWFYCPESVSGHDSSGRRDGKCTWCLKPIDSSQPRPDSFPGPSELTDWYGIYFDPDYTTGKDYS